MAIVLAQPRYIFGVRSGVNANVLYQDEHTIVYPSGSNIVVYNIDQKTQKFIQCSEKSRGMTAMAISPNKRFLAVAERGNLEKGEKTLIVVYDLSLLRKRKILSLSDLRSDEFVSLAFSPDSRYLAAQGGQPDWTLACWIWEKSKLLATIKTTNPQTNPPIHQVTFNSEDNSHMCVVGLGVCKQFRYSEGALKQFAFQKSDPLNYLCHAWASPELLLVGSENGKVQVMELGELKQEFTISAITAVVNPSHPEEISGSSTDVSKDHSHANETVSELPVTAIVAFAKGFACAAGSGLVHLFEKSEEDYYKKIREIQIPPDPYSIDSTRCQEQTFSCLIVSPSEETVIGCTTSGQLYFYTLTAVEVAKSERVPFEVVSQVFHANVITGLDLCIRKPLIATCSVDKSVRIWNYENCELDIYKEFSEEAYSVALHPSGLYVLVGFENKLNLMNLLIDDIKTFQEFDIKSCRECCFSRGGHLFAAVHSNVIQIYSTTTFENVSNMKGHNGKVRCIVWNSDDSKIISCGMEGAVYEWEVLTMRRVSENVLKTCQYNGVALSPDGKTIYAVGSDMTIKEIIDSQVMRIVESHEMVLSSITLSHSGKVMFVGTIAGTVRSMKFPLTVPGEWVEFQGHECPITKIKMTYDDQYLISVSEDACVMIWKVQDKEGHGVKRDKEITFAEEILITKSDLEEKNTMTAELRLRVDELKNENQYQLRLRDLNYGEKIKELTEKFVQEIESLKAKNQAMKVEKDRDDMLHEDEVNKLLERHTNTLEELETVHSQKMMMEYEKYQELQTKSQRMQEDYECKLLEAEERKEIALEELTDFYENKLQELAGKLDQAHTEFKQAQRECEETQRQIEEDVDKEVMNLKIRYENLLRDEKETTQKVKAEMTLFRKKFSILQKDMEDRKEEIRKSQIEAGKLNNVIKNLDKDIHLLKKEIQERDDTIQDKEKRIYELKKKNQELEKFKFVLDYKIKELKKQIEPRENELKRVKQQILEMEGELGRFHTQNVILEQRIAQEVEKLRAAENELYRERRKIRDRDVVIQRIKNDIHHCTGLIQDPKLLKEDIIAMHRKHVTERDIIQAAELDADVVCELGRQREHLEATVTTLRKQLGKDSETQKHDHLRVMQENVMLIREISELRRELKGSRINALGLESALGLHRKNNKISIAEVVQKLSDGTKNAQLSRELSETKKVVNLQKQEILQLRNEVCELKKTILNMPGTQDNSLPPLAAKT